MPGAVLGARGTRDDPALVELTSAWEWGCLGVTSGGAGQCKKQGESLGF